MLHVCQNYFKKQFDFKLLLADKKVKNAASFRSCGKVSRRSADGNQRFRDKKTSAVNNKKNQEKLDKQGKARREAARRRNSEYKIKK